MILLLLTTIFNIKEKYVYLISALKCTFDFLISYVFNFVRKKTHTELTLCYLCIIVNGKPNKSNLLLINVDLHRYQMFYLIIILSQ